MIQLLKQFARDDLFPVDQLMQDPAVLELFFGSQPLPKPSLQADKHPDVCYH